MGSDKVGEFFESRPKLQEQLVFFLHRGKIVGIFFLADRTELVQPIHFGKEGLVQIPEVIADRVHLAVDGFQDDQGIPSTQAAS